MKNYHIITKCKRNYILSPVIVFQWIDKVKSLRKEYKFLKQVKYTGIWSEWVTKILNENNFSLYEMEKFKLLFIDRKTCCLSVHKNNPDMIQWILRIKEFLF